MSFENKVILITGASSGIGAATAVEFAKQRASVAIVGRNAVKLQTVNEECQKHGVTPLIINIDISKEEAANEIIDKTIEKYGRLDVLVNNAGIVATGGLLDGAVMKSYDKIMNTNLRAVVALTSAAVPYLIKSKGNIVNVSSTLATQAGPLMMAYCVSKAGLDHFSNTAALELAAAGVRVNIVTPGPVVTDILENAGMPNTWEDWGKRTPLGKVAYSTEVADVILFLASDKAHSITGGNLTIDNGIRLKL
ncbi:3-oxoacyl-[acyl-carrier-protein] reductase FabG-like [Spodoptera frugiperda]|uniref:3-oxoacyl-[acyl-carrier-protein] reductase FabG-like n=1 Tax=Spodoptera frugiperda TaxID=7108 RepID=A0A9R0DCI0_SPOFR|nr:3-oxoacyl-[acyl-carrier-protein] reductase FabG-like [Spodoptera frugiperda]